MTDQETQETISRLVLAKDVRGLNEFGQSLMQRERPDLAETTFLDLVALVRLQVTRAEDDALRQLGEHLFQLSSVRCELSKYPQALEDAIEALGVFRKLSKTTPEMAEQNRAGFNGRIAACLCRLADIHSALTALEKARDCLLEAIEIYRELALQNPEDFNMSLAGALRQLMAVHGALGAHTEAYNCALASVSLLEQHMTEGGTGEPFELNAVDNSLLQPPKFQHDKPGSSDFQAAIALSGRICRLKQSYRLLGLDKDTRRELSLASLDVFETHINCCLAIGRDRVGTSDVSGLEEAVWASEACRSRQLIDGLNGLEIRPVSTPPELEEQFRGLSRKIDALLAAQEPESLTTLLFHAGDRGIDFGEGAAASINPTKEFRQEVDELEGKRARLLDEILQHDPGYRPEGIKACTCAELRSLIPGDCPTAFVQYSCGREASFAFIVTADAVEPVQLPGVTAQKLAEIADAWFRGYAGARNSLGSGRSWEEHADFILNWNLPMQDLLVRVGELALAPVIESLPPGTKRLVIAPHQALHLFPLHACPIVDHRTLLIDAFEISYTPSFSILHHCARPVSISMSGNDGAEFLLVANPTGDLLFSEIEGEVLACRFRSSGSLRRLRHGNVRKKGLRSGVLDCRCFHYSGHANFNYGNPLDSALVLSGDSLTLREIFAGFRLRRNELTILNGCESGLLLPDSLDDYHNFTTGFLFAGSRSVVSTLWSIPDLPSALLMDRFHAHWLSGEPVASALNQAQNWLRKLRVGETFEAALGALVSNVADEAFARAARKQSSLYVEVFGEMPFELPVHWAAFTSNGLCYPHDER